jgi:hypothetical protein
VDALLSLLAAAWQVAEPIVSAWLKRDERRVGGDA